MYKKYVSKSGNVKNVFFPNAGNIRKLYLAGCQIILPLDTCSPKKISKKTTKSRHK